MRSFFSLNSPSVSTLSSNNYFALFRSSKQLRQIDTAFIDDNSCALVGDFSFAGVLIALTIADVAPAIKSATPSLGGFFLL